LTSHHALALSHNKNPLTPLSPDTTANNLPLSPSESSQNENLVSSALTNNHNRLMNMLPPLLDTFNLDKGRNNINEVEEAAQLTLRN
jgi:hypothetical protein